MIYFDNGATTKPYNEVIDTFVKVSEQLYGNPSSLHKFGGTAEKLLTKARLQISELLNVEIDEVFFTSGGTESNNLAIKGTAFQYKNRGKHLITTETEHASVSKTFKQLEEFGFETTFINVDSTGRINIEQLKDALRDDTILVSVAHVNNEVGTIQPLKEISDILKDYPKVLFHVDNVQGIGKVPLNVSQYNIDLCSYSAHKFHGLKGNGILYKRSGCQLSPLFTGGSQEGQVRGGTENVAGIIAMSKALRLMIEQSEKQLSNMLSINSFLRRELQKLGPITINTSEENSAPHILNFSLKGINSETFIHALSEEDIYVSTTSACSSKKRQPSKTLLAMGLDMEAASNAVRISLSYSNTLEEAEQVIKVIKKALKTLER